MSYSFEYIDIILLAMIAGFIFLRLRGILGKKTGYEEDISASFPNDFTANPRKQNLKKYTFNDDEKKEFLKGANIAYETIITSFAKGDVTKIQYLLDKKVYEQFNQAINDRNSKGYISETTFIGVNSYKSKITTCKSCGSISLGLSKTCINCGANLGNITNNNQFNKKPSESTIEVNAEEVK